MIEQVTSMAVTPDVALPAASEKQAESGFGVSLTDVSAFGQSVENAEAKNGVEQVSEVSNVEKAIAKPLDYLNNEASGIVKYATEAVEKGMELSPGEIVMLTAKSHEFMFHAQLTANIANRSSEGLQQLFRQQG